MPFYFKAALLTAKAASNTFVNFFLESGIFIAKESYKNGT